MVDGVNAITKCPAAARAQTAEEAKRKRVEEAPLYLRGRVEGDLKLPKVEVRSLRRRSKRLRSGEAAAAAGGGGGEDEAERKEEELRAVVGHVAREMKGELVVDVMEYLGELVRAYTGCYI